MAFPYQSLWVKEHTTVRPREFKLALKTRPVQFADNTNVLEIMAPFNNNTNNSAFPSEQAQILQDIARDGNADEHGYGDNTQANGTFHRRGYSTSSDAYYPSAGLDGLDELDPATLLESLANFEHPASSSEPPAPSERHFESLLQAVASADGQEAARASRSQKQNKSSAKQPSPTDQYGFPISKPTTTRTRRKRQQVEDEDSGEDFGFILTKSRRTRHAQVDTPEQLAIEHEIWGPDEFEFEGIEGHGPSSTIPLAGANARAAGVHSAAALFRRPSAASKKYTRPPMSKLFTSLELHPEHFLHLQAAAKNYMLDARYPERSDCVGNKDRGDTDMTKLKLFGCVESFLEDGGWGEKCFGANAPGAKTRKLKWPLMKNKVISLITPLLRRMVTNERQRVYALEMRKTKPQGTYQRKAKKAKNEQRLSAPSPSLSPVIDPKLDNYHYDVDETFQPGNAQQLSIIASQTTNGGQRDDSMTPAIDVGVPKKYLINIMHGTRRIKPETALTPGSCSDFSNLSQHVQTIINDDNLRVGKLRALGPGGMIDIRNEAEWENALAVIMEVEWLNGEVKCIVEVEEIRR